MGNILSSHNSKSKDQLTLARNTATYWEQHYKSIVQENSRLHSIIEQIQKEQEIKN
jgi:hypothetical protein